MKYEQVQINLIHGDFCETSKQKPKNPHIQGNARCAMGTDKERTNTTK